MGRICGAVRVAGVQLPVSVLGRLDVMERFWFEALGWEFLKALVEALGWEFRGLEMEKVRS